ncbi:MAG: prepilin-type N-terminal cleavage/methylation domain-containing protein [Deferribacteraceae bacterium]|nr:prepilin-type N-terminal cleavage/methylation domain-containing protein [Deferribacteraceae bacterium]
MIKNKGFTVYELAIVLIIIGLIMGIVLKVSATIDVAKLKKECAKFENMRSALTIYYKLYKGFPGMGSTDANVIILANSKLAENDLIDATLLNENDFQVGINPAADAGYHYYFTRCVSDDGTKTVDGNGEFYSFAFYPDTIKNIAANKTIPTGSICIGAYKPASTGYEGFDNATPQSLRAAYELYFDDKRIDHGYARRAHDRNDPFTKSIFDSDNLTEELKFLQEQIYGTGYIGNGSAPDNPERGGKAYFVKVF